MLPTKRLTINSFLVSMKKSGPIKNKTQKRKSVIGDVNAPDLAAIEQQRYKDALKERDERLNLVLKASGLGTYEYITSIKETIWDSRMHEIFGLDEDTEVKRIDYFFDVLHPEDVHWMKERFHFFINPKSEITFYENEYRIIVKDEVRYIQSNGLVSRNEKGEVLRIVGTCNDVTDNKKRELLIKSSLEKLEIAERIAKFGAYETRLDDRKIWWSKGLYEIFEVDPSMPPLDGAAFMQLVHPEDQSHLMEVVADAIRKRRRESNHLEFRLQFPDGRIKYLVNKFQLILDENQRVELINGTSQDVTEAKLVERQLKESEERFSKSFHSNVTPMAIFDIEKGKRVDLNDSFINLFGYSRESFMKGSLIHNNLWADKKVHQKVIEMIKRDKFLHNFEADFINSKGETMTLIINSIMLRIGDGNMGISTFVDVTDKKRAKAALEKSELQYRTLVENSHELIWEVDSESKIVFINQVSKAIYGYNPKDMLGKSFLDFVRPKYVAYAKDYFNKAITSGIDVFHFEGTVLNKDGSLVVLDSHAVVKRDRNGDLIGIMGTSQDITERKKAEKKIKNAQQELKIITERFQLSTEASKIGIWDWDIKNDQLVWDKTMFDIYGASEHSNSHYLEGWINSFHPDDVNRCKKELGMAMRGEKSFATEFRLIWPDGSIRFVKANATVYFNEKGEAIRMLGTNTDITKEKEAELQKLRAQQLEIRNKELEQFAYVSSHDLKEPLRTVKSFSELLKAQYENQLDENANKYLNFISQAASRMDQVIKALLDYSQIGQKKELVYVNCQVVVRDLMKDLDTLIKETKVTININPLPSIKAHSTEIRMLFQNLISNAIKFRNQDVDTVISISVTKRSSQWEFCVADNGMGIKEEYQSKIFALFQRLHARDEYEGTGIGLAHCQKIVEIHGGKIWVKSKAELGSKFYFTIPFYPASREDDK